MKASRATITATLSTGRGIVRFLAAVALFLCLLQPYAAHAVEDCTISENVAFEFATLEKPSGSKTYVIDASGGADSGTGTLLYGATARGSYKLKKSGGGGGFTSVTIDIQNVSTGNANLTLTNFTGNYGGTAIASFPAAGLPKPASGGGTTLYLGATATYNGSVPIGALTPTFDIVVTYQ